VKVWRIESARLIAGLVRMVRNVGLADDLAQEALITGDVGCSLSLGPGYRSRPLRNR
jgi:hypothetical protein